MAFEFRGKKFNYFCHWSNTTWKNERCVEIPIAYHFLKTHSNGNVLEFGNVLSHYYPVQHDIVDKYERAPGVMNVDVVEFHPDKKYRLIISISTLEHVGWDERPRDPMKILQAIDNLRSLLAPEGIMLITVPMGYNTELDEMLRERKIPSAETYGLKRISRSNNWKEVEWNAIANAKYGAPFPFANGVVIGIFRNEL